MDNVETFDVQGLRVTLRYDQTADSPASWDTLGTLRTWLDRYNIGHGAETDPADAPDDPGEWAAFLDAAGAVYLPVYAYIHGGVTLSAGPFACPWDSGQAGFIYAMPDAVRECFGADVDPATEAGRERVADALRAELADWDCFVRGDVYGYEVERIPGCDREDCDAPLDPCGNCDADAEHLDSCWGFYGLDYARDNAREAAESCAAEVAEAPADYVTACAAIAAKGGARA